MRCEEQSQKANKENEAIYTHSVWSGRYEIALIGFLFKWFQWIYEKKNIENKNLYVKIQTITI